MEISCFLPTFARECKRWYRMLKTLVYIGVGSCFGGVARYLLSQLIREKVGAAFPWGTFVVNVLGCFIIGVIYGMIDRGYPMSNEMRAFLTVGFCGGFTTFSTFVYETHQLLSTSGLLLMAVYAGISFAAGLICAYMGQMLVRNVL